MFDHVGLKVSDLPRSVRFYKSALATLGHELGSEGDWRKPGDRRVVHPAKHSLATPRAVRSEIAQ